MTPSELIYSPANYNEIPPQKSGPNGPYHTTEDEMVEEEEEATVAK